LSGGSAAFMNNPGESKNMEDMLHVYCLMDENGKWKKKIPLKIAKKATFLHVVTSIYMRINDEKNKENKMKFIDKLAIFLAAVLITFVGFSLIASPSIDMLKLGKKAGYEIISNVLAKEASAVASHRASV